MKAHVARSEGSQKNSYNIVLALCLCVASGYWKCAILHINFFNSQYILQRLKILTMIASNFTPMGFLLHWH